MADDTSCPQEIDCCGRVYVVRRELGIAKRLESSFGPCLPLSERMERSEITVQDLTGIYAICVAGQSDAPERGAIEEWLFAVGTRKAALQLRWFVASLVIGNDLARKLHDRLLASADGDRREEAPEARRPFSPVAA